MTTTTIEHASKTSYWVPFGTVFVNIDDYDHDPYILANVGNGFACLIHLVTGNRYCDPVLVTITSGGSISRDCLNDVTNRNIGSFIEVNEMLVKLK